MTNDNSSAKLKKKLLQNDNLEGEHMTKREALLLTAAAALGAVLAGLTEWGMGLRAGLGLIDGIGDGLRALSGLGYAGNLAAWAICLAGGRTAVGMGCGISGAGAGCTGRTRCCCCWPPSFCTASTGLPIGPP